MENKYDLTMLVMDGCGHCAKAKEALKPFIDSGRIQVRDVAHDPVARELAKTNNITAVPQFIARDKVLHTTEVCELTQEANKIICNNGKEVKL